MARCYCYTHRVFPVIFIRHFFAIFRICCFHQYLIIIHYNCSKARNNVLKKLQYIGVQVELQAKTSYFHSNRSRIMAIRWSKLQILKFNPHSASCTLSGLSTVSIYSHCSWSYYIDKFTLICEPILLDSDYDCIVNIKSLTRCSNRFFRIYYLHRMVT